MRKNRIRLTESQLHQVIKESVKNVLKEYNESDYITDFNEEGISNDICRLLNSLIAIHKYEDGHYRVLVPPHFASQMKILENEGIEFVSCDSNYTPMAIYINNEAIKNRVDDIIGQITY